MTVYHSLIKSNWLKLSPIPHPANNNGREESQGEGKALINAKSGCGAGFIQGLI